MEKRKQNRKKLYSRIAVYTVLLAGLLIYWEHSAGNSNKVRLLLSSPSLVYGYFIENYALLLEATLTTFYEAFSGLLIATAFALGTMVVCLYFPRLMDYVLPIMISSQVIPLITLAPFFIMVFGIGLGSKITMAALISFFPVFVNFASGVKLIPKNVTELMDINNATTTQKIRLVYFPQSMPHIFAGLKVAATLSVIGAIVAEFSGAKVGIGKNLFLAAMRLEPELMMNSLVLSGLLGGFMYGFIYFIEKKLGEWYIKF